MPIALHAMRRHLTLVLIINDMPFPIGRDGPLERGQEEVGQLVC